jgi:hypothetical protein
MCHLDITLLLLLSLASLAFFLLSICLDCETARSLCADHLLLILELTLLGQVLLPYCLCAFLKNGKDVVFDVLSQLLLIHVPRTEYGCQELLVIFQCDSDALPGVGCKSKFSVRPLICFHAEDHSGFVLYDIFGIDHSLILIFILWLRVDLDAL